MMEQIKESAACGTVRVSGYISKRSFSGNAPGTPVCGSFLPHLPFSPAADIGFFKKARSNG